jgi:lipoate-protein ligase A
VCIPDLTGRGWRLLPFDTGASEFHFALSDALVRESPRQTVWWHTTDEPTLILGAGQRSVDGAEAVRRGIHVVRRSAGGTAVYAGPGVLGQDVFLPAGHGLNSTDVVETYRWLGEIWQEGLARLGVHADLVSVEAARARPHVDPAVAMVCFGSLSPYEVTVEGRKLVGLAQVRRAHGTLLQAGIHLHFDPVGISRVLPVSDPRHRAVQLSRAATGLNDVAPVRITLPQVASVIDSVISHRTGEPVLPGEWTERERERARENWARGRRDAGAG